MSLITISELLEFCEVEKGYFIITASNDILKLSYDGGADTNIDIDDGTYEGADLATELQSKIDTAFTISSTVSYSTTTKKFTITVSAGHTIAYTNVGSDAGLTLGFNQDHTDALSITSDLAAGDPSSILESIRDGVEDWISEECRRTFESTSYAKYYDGQGGSYLMLDNYPIINLTRVCIGRRYAIRIKNTSTYTSATVSVTSTGIILTKDDTSDSTLLFASYATMALMVAAINAIGSGWYAEIESSDYNNFKSSELVQMFGRNTIDSNWVYLEMPDEAIDDFEVNPEAGWLFRDGGWPEGERNIFVKFTAGYSTIPKRLKLGVEIACKCIYQKRKEETFGVSRYTIGDINITEEAKEFPKEVLSIINQFRRPLI